MKRILIYLTVVLSLTALGKDVFVHPGASLTREDLDFVKANLHREPWKSGYQLLKNDYHSQLDYKMRGPFEEIARFPSKNINLRPWRDDMIAVYNLARMWYFTGDEAYARKGRDIIIAWAETQKKFDGWESMLDLGDYVHRFAGGADILRGTWSGWTDEDTRKVSKLFNDVYWPATNLSQKWIGPANKGTLAIAAGIGMAVFMDDREKFEYCMDLLLSHGPSALPNTVSTGQIGESGRDLGHNYGQWVSMAYAAEVAWKQGYDVYSYLDNRLLAVGEYYSRHAQGYEIPFITYGTTDFWYHVPAKSGWNLGRRGMNMLITAYQFRKGIQTPCLDLSRLRAPIDAEAFCHYLPQDKSTAKPATFNFPETKSVSEGLKTKDIGNSTPSGKAVYSNGVWTLTGGGEEIWRHGNKQGGDSFFYAFKEAEGDCTIIARVDSIEGPRGNGKAAVMYRQELSPDSRKAWIAAIPDKNVEYFMSGWTTIRGNWEKGARPFSDNFPVWLKIDRIGKMLYQYWSPDGTSWSCISAGYFEKLEDKGYLGLAVCSLQNGTPIKVNFSNVSITGGDGKAPHSIPAAPLKILANGADHEVQLRWSQSAGATKYQIKRAMQADGPYEIIGSTQYSFYFDATAENGRTYYYKVSALNGPDSTSVFAAPQRKLVNITGKGISRASRNSDDGLEGANKAFDQSFDTFWSSSQKKSISNIRYDVGPENAGKEVIAYALAVPYKEQQTDPADWDFEGSHDGEKWIVLDSQKDYKFVQRAMPYTFHLKQPAKYRHYRLKITKNQGEGVNLAELMILAVPEAS